MTARITWIPAGWHRDEHPDPLTVRLVRDDEPRRCHCGRPVPASSECGCCCAECDDVASTARTIAAAMDRHPAGKAKTDGGPSLREYLQSKGEM